eukprot:Gb_40012 [translate_table: standard]
MHFPNELGSAQMFNIGISAPMTNQYILCQTNVNNTLGRLCAFSPCYKPLCKSPRTFNFCVVRSTFNHCSVLRGYVPFTHTITPVDQKRPLYVRCSTSDERMPDETPGGSNLNATRTGSGVDWITSILLFVFWAALLYYVFFLSPNQTPYRDVYFLRKLLNLEGDDGFQINQVLVSLWYVMGLWPVVYSMLLLPSGRSSKNKVPVWPFLVLSFFGGAYALLPYFGLWRPPPPAVGKTELERWPLNLVESKVTAMALVFGGLVLAINAGVAGEDAWKEFFQYFRESKFIHATSIDFLTLWSLSPFWVYNDMTVRKWFNKGSWLLPLTLVPYLGPTLYLILRPPLPSAMVDDEQNT